MWCQTDHVIYTHSTANMWMLVVNSIWVAVADPGGVLEYFLILPIMFCKMRIISGLLHENGWDINLIIIWQCSCSFRPSAIGWFFCKMACKKYCFQDNLTLSYIREWNIWHHKILQKWEMAWNFRDQTKTLSSGIHLFAFVIHILTITIPCKRLVHMTLLPDLTLACLQFLHPLLSLGSNSSFQKKSFAYASKIKWSLPKKIYRVRHA